MTALDLPPLTWPPTPDQPARWHAHLAAALADLHAHLAAAHHQLSALLAAPAPPPDDLPGRLQAIAAAAVDPHDSLALHQLLTRHHQHTAAVHLTRAHTHRRDALNELRHLARDTAHHRVDPAHIHPRLTAAAHLNAAGHALIDADRTLFLPTTGGDRYSQ